MREFLRAAAIVAGKDLRIELRTKEILVTTGLFAMLVVVIASLSFYLDGESGKKLAPGVLWIAIAFAGVLALGRTWARERDADAMRALLLTPIPRAAIYLGKAFGVLLFLLVIELLIVPTVALLFHIDLLDVLGPLVLLVVLGTTGFVAAGTLFASMSVRTQARDLMLSVVIFPLVAPTLLAGVVGTRELFGGAPLEEVLAWARILAAFVIVFVASGLALFEPLTSD